MLFKKEKAGFEEENRKRFGQHTKLGKGRYSGKKANGTNVSDDASVEDGDDQAEDASDFDLLDGEDDAASEDESNVAPHRIRAPKAKRKCRKKKRTKRK